MTHLSLFSGVGGIDLAAEWAGFETVQFVELDQFCQKVLAKNFPGVPIHDNVTTFDGTKFAGTVDLLSGGFPCQDISTASSNVFARGIEGEKSGLFWQALRIIKEARPTWIVLENVYQLKHRGLAQCQRELEEAGYILESLVLGAGSTGATHQRKRFWLVGYSNSNSQPNKPFNDEAFRLSELEGFSRRPPDSRDIRENDGIPRRMDRPRLKALGNAVCPQQAYPILKAIAETYKDTKK